MHLKISGLDLLHCRKDRSSDLDRISIHYVNNFFGQEKAAKLMKSAGLCGVDGSLPNTMSKIDFWLLCLDNINHSNDEGHGCTTHALPKSSWSMIFSAVNQMETIGHGVRRFTELVPVLSAGISVTMGYSAEKVRLTYSLDPCIEDTERGERYLELIALVFHCVLLWCSNRCLPVGSLRLSGQLDEKDGSMISGLCANQTREGAGLTLTYHQEDLAFPLGVRRYKCWAKHETTTFLEIAPSFKTPCDSSQHGIPGAVKKLLISNNLSQQQTASTLGLSAATLQRRLAQAGTSFREISKDVRKEKLSYLLLTDGNLDDIAEELGFSERRSLWRACHEWLGMSPTQYRQQYIKSTNCA